MLQALAIAACLTAATVLWLRSWAGPGRAVGAAAIVLGGLLALALAPAARSAPQGAPHERARGGYVSSSACRSCHPGEYQSWHRSFHRSMTQLATPESVQAPFAGTRVEIDGRSVDLEQQGTEFWATLPDPDLIDDAASAPLVRRRVVLTTGSHHYQAYWVTGKRGNELRLLPAVYLLAEKRWVPRRDAFLQPPSAHARAVRWNSNCVQCHSVAGRPAHEEATDRFETEVAELGIACEACHGPGEAHVARQQNPVLRYVSRFSEGGDSTIVQPEHLAPERASEVCAQCHSYFVPRDESSWWQSGFAERYSAGQPLAASRVVLDYEMKGGPELVDADFDSIFWPDGTMRVGGREYNAMVASRCYQDGRANQRLSCLSCHSMHDSEPDDQLSKLGASGEACSHCHSDVAAQGSQHTHHPAGSAGSSCYGCHMPFTSYALFKGIRSHRIDSPNGRSQLASGKPNACNLCHTDRTLAWTGEHLQRWYGQAPAELESRERDTSAMLVLLLAGDAAQRAVAAFALGQAEARRASVSGFQAPALALLLDDPYSAVRLVAYRALRQQPGFADLEYDFLAEPEVRRAALRGVLEQHRSRPPQELRPELLLLHDGSPNESTIDVLRAQRDDRPITIAE